jgi:hypothetical protein
VVSVSSIIVETLVAPPYAFAPDDSPTIGRLPAALVRRANARAPILPSLPDAALVTRRVVPRVDLSQPSLQSVLNQFVIALGEPYRSLVAREALFSPLSLDHALSSLGSWLIGGIAGEVGVFDEDPDAGWGFAAELLRALDQPSGARFYWSKAEFDSRCFQRTLFAVAAERLATIYVIGTD